MSFHSFFLQLVQLVKCYSIMRYGIGSRIMSTLQALYLILTGPSFGQSPCPFCTTCKMDRLALNILYSTIHLSPTLTLLSTYVLVTKSMDIFIYTKYMYLLCPMHIFFFSYCSSCSTLLYILSSHSF